MKKSGKEDKPVLSEAEVMSINKALADPRRFELFRHIAQGESVTCSECRESIPISPATMSHHLKELESAGLITSSREGKFMRLDLRKKVWKSYLSHLKELAS